MADEIFQIASWKIENLSSWNRFLHRNYIRSLEICFHNCDFVMVLYPRGACGQEDHMVVRLSFGIQKEELSGDLSIIGGDGSLLWTQRVHSKEDEDLELPPGPKFEEVIAKGSGSESDRKDKLTLRFKIKSNKGRNEELHVCTVIQVSEITMKVEPSVILRENRKISNIQDVHNDYNTFFYLLTGTISENEKIELCLEPISDQTVLVKTHMSFISSVGSVLRYENNEHLYRKAESWAFSETPTNEDLSEKVSYIILHFKIISGNLSHTLRQLYFYWDEMEVIPKSFKTKDDTSHKDQENASVDVLSKELICLYQDHDFSDLQLKCESVSFPVHRNILSARSSVFKTMLSTDMAEATSGCVEIDDLDPSTLSSFLAFLYTGVVEDLQGESALKIYYAADKYNVPSLKRECVAFLSANVSVSNVCDVLSLGDKHRDEKLTATAHDFILRNYNDVLKSREWNTFMCSEPLLAAKTFTTFAEKDFVILTFNPLL